jgi:hypothetical protein
MPVTMHTTLLVMADRIPAAPAVPAAPVNVFAMPCIGFLATVHVTRPMER